MHHSKKKANFNSRLSFVTIPPGKCTIGAENDDKEAFDNEKPPKEVHIYETFEMGVHPITQGMYFEVTGQKPASTPEFAKDCPVDNVSWYDAIAFCNRLSSIHGYPLFYTVEGRDVSPYGGNGYRLPSEAEWEYACRAYTKTRYFFGDTPENLPDYAWFEANSNNKIHPVALKKPNPFDLYDMYGNVWEWCFDNYVHQDHYRDYAEKWTKLSDDAVSIFINRTRILRGGAFDMPARMLRSSNRDVCGPGVRHTGNSFRIVKNL